MKQKPEKQVLIWRGKHCDEYWDASGDKELGAFLAMFKMLDDNEMYYGIADNTWEDTSKDMEKFKKEHDELKALLPTLPESLKGEANKKISYAVRNYRELDNLSRQRELYVKAKAGDGLSAKRLIQDRRDYEYEGYDLRPLNDPELCKI
jgi:hypothetical protein